MFIEHSNKFECSIFILTTSYEHRIRTKMVPLQKNLSYDKN